VVETEVAVGDHVAGLLNLVFRTEDQPGGPADGRAHVATAERGGAARVRIGESPAVTDEPVAG
jgi:hypothetical protein